MAGTNDMIGQDVSNAPTRFMQLIDKIFTASPDATVFVASLIPLSFSQANVDQYNTRIQTLVQQRITSGQKLVWVSMASVTNSDLADGVHPNAGGYVKMGQAWYNGWVSARQRGWVA
jgi:lysophospholipase L1-like esterase